MRFVIIAFITIVSSFSAQAQDAVRQLHPRYMHNAEVRHLDNSVTVTANAPRPLADSVKALSEEYAWVIDFEDPQYYSKYDLVDDTDPKWRAANPTAKGFTLIAGDSFQTQFPENPNAATSSAEEEHILENVVSDYNASTNPGRFSVVSEGDGRFAIVGTQVKDENGQNQAVSPILDTPITVQTDTRDPFETIQVILRALSTERQIKVVPGTGAFGGLRPQPRVTVGGQNVPARILLLQTLSAAKMKLYWHLYYDNDVKSYALNLLPLMKVEYDAAGNRTTVLVR